MISERGTIIVSTAMDERMQKELSRTSLITSVVLLVIGCVGLVAYIALSVLLEVFGVPEPDSTNILLILGAICFVLGLFLLLLLKSVIKKIRNTARVNNYEFFNGYFIISETNYGELTATVKVYNSQIIKGKETKNYLFFFIQSSAAFPVLKENLTEGELNTLRRLFKLRVTGEATVIPPEVLPVNGVQSAVPPEGAPLNGEFGAVPPQPVNVGPAYVPHGTEPLASPQPVNGENGAGSFADFDKK